MRQPHLAVSCVAVAARAAGLGKPYDRIHPLKQGSLAGAILKALREAGKPCLRNELVTAVVAATGASEVARHTLAHRVRASLQYLWCDRQTIVKHGRAEG